MKKQNNPGETSCTFSYELSVRTRLESLAKGAAVELSLAQMMRLAATFLADNAEARGLHEIWREVVESRGTKRMHLAFPAGTPSDAIAEILEAVRKVMRDRNLGPIGLKFEGAAASQNEPESGTETGTKPQARPQKPKK